jgi:hypothetical protein
MCNVVGRIRLAHFYVATNEEQSNCMRLVADPKNSHHARSLKTRSPLLRDYGSGDVDQ